MEQEMNEVKISVIMPVYRVEDYVGRAIESMQKQTLQEFEFLIVDDGSPDRSGEICDAYAKKDARIRVFHRKNQGAPAARNAAMDLAKGKYLYFLDSDDWAEPEMLEEMYRLAEKYRAELVVAGFYIDTYYGENQFRSDDYVPEDAVYMTKEEFRRNSYRLFDRNMLYTPWNKLYLREYIEKHRLRFPKTMWDDFPFNLSVIDQVERVAVTSRQYYHFIRARAESETAAYRPGMYEKREEEHGWLLDLYRRWNIRTPETAEFIARRYIERFIGCVENLTNPNCRMNYRQKRREVRKMLKNERVAKSLRLAKPRSFYMKVMLIPVRMRNVTLLLLEASVITFVKTKNTRLFARLKAGR